MQRRAQERRETLSYWKVFDAQSERLLGRLTNVTTEGLQVHSEQPIPENADYHIRIETPEDITGYGRVFINARSMWCQKNPMTDLYSAGFKITGQLPEYVDAVRRLIEHFSYPAPPQPGIESVPRPR
jgi:hypothetical protein